MATSYYKDVRYTLETTTRNKLIRGTDDSMVYFTEQSKSSLTKYDKDLLNNSLRCDIRCDEYVLEGIFIEGLLEIITRSIRSNWGSEEKATVHDRSRHGKSLMKLETGSCNTNAPDISKKLKPDEAKWMQRRACS